MVYLNINPSYEEPDIVTAGPHAREKLPPIYSSGLVQFVVKLLDDWKLDQSDAVCLLGYEDQDMEYVHNLLREIEPLRGLDVKLRISKLFYIRHSLWSLFQNLEVENQWLRESQNLLNDEIPIEMIRSGKIDSLILLEEYVDMITGM